ncbi:hypothetical protein K3495_g5578 [Podosphaera aphanis]|nr:hypothetical protein K3495_g5578 [Podosphaera aphanis]
MRKLSQHKISSIASLLAEDENEAEVAGILGFDRATVAMYRIKAPNNVVAPVLGKLLKLTSREKRGLAPLIPNGSTKASVMARSPITHDVSYGIESAG